MCIKHNRSYEPCSSAHCNAHIHYMISARHNRGASYVSKTERKKIHKHYDNSKLTFILQQLFNLRHKILSTWIKPLQPLYKTCSPPSLQYHQIICCCAMNSLLNKKSFWLRPYHKLTA